MNVRLDAIDGARDLVSSLGEEQQILRWAPTSAVGKSGVSLWIASQNDLLDFEKHDNLTFTVREHSVGYSYNVFVN